MTNVRTSEVEREIRVTESRGKSKKETFYVKQAMKA
jgi:hypothetical protein